MIITGDTPDVKDEILPHCDSEDEGCSDFVAFDAVLAEVEQSKALLEDQLSELTQQLDSKQEQFNELKRHYDALHQEFQKQQDSLQKSEATNGRLEGELRNREQQKHVLERTVSEFESKLFGEGDDTHFDLNNILNSYRRLYTLFMDEILENEDLNKSFKESVEIAHFILSKAFAGASHYKKNLTLPTLLHEVERSEEHSRFVQQMTQHAERCMLKKSSRHVLDHYKSRFLNELTGRVIVHLGNNERLAKVWNSRFVVECAEVAWKCQWHGINDRMTWKLILPSTPQDLKLYQSCVQWKGCQIARSSLTPSDFEEIERDRTSEFFVVWPMLAACEGNDKVQPEQSFFQVVLRE